MKTKMIAALVAAVFLTTGGVAFAQPGNNGGGQGGCGTGQHTNGCTPGGGQGGAGGSATGGAGFGVGIGVGIGGGATANGGQGGAGGQGGQGGYANSTNLNGNLNANRNQNSNDNRNTNSNANNNTNRNNLANSQGQGQDQGQLQGQLQGQVAKGGTAVSGGNTLQGTQANGQSVSVTGDTVTYEAQSRNPVNTAYAPNIAPTATCMGSTSAGAQGIGFGISVGSTWTAAECQTLEQGRFAAQVLGQQDVAAEIACSLDKYREARKRVGKPCDEDKTQTAAVAKQPETQPVESVSEQEARKRVAYYGNDPIVMARLGLAPLKK